MPALLSAPPPHPTFSRSALILVLGLVFLLVLFAGLYLIIRFGRGVIAQRRGASVVDMEASLAVGGVVPGVKRSKTKASATVSPAQVLEKAREATPTPLLQTPARVKCGSILAHRVHIQAQEVAPGRLIVRQVHARPGPTPLRAVLTAEAESAVPCLEPNPVKDAGFDHLFAGSLEDNEDEDTDEHEDVQFDATFWLPCGDGARPALVLPDIKSFKVLAPTYVEGTIPRKPSKAFVHYAAGPLIGTGHNRISIRGVKPSPKVQAVDGKENRFSSGSRIPRRVF